MYENSFFRILSAVFVLLLVILLQIYTVSAEFENSWIQYLEQPCCGGTGNHHVRHHRGELSDILS